MSYLGGIGEIMLSAVGVTLGIVGLRLDDYPFQRGYCFIKAKKC